MEEKHAKRPKTNRRGRHKVCHKYRVPFALPGRFLSLYFESNFLRCVCLKSFEADAAAKLTSTTGLDRLQQFLEAVRRF